MMAAGTHQKHGDWLAFGVTLFCVVGGMVRGVVGSHCGACDPAECGEVDVSTCPRGLAKDQCDCCQVCANDVGQSCGGHSEGFHGDCGDGLSCKKALLSVLYYGKEKADGICVEENAREVRQRRSYGMAAPVAAAPVAASPVAVAPSHARKVYSYRKKASSYKKHTRHVKKVHRKKVSRRVRHYKKKYTRRHYKKVAAAKKHYVRTGTACVTCIHGGRHRRSALIEKVKEAGCGPEGCSLIN